MKRKYKTYDSIPSGTCLRVKRMIVKTAINITGNLDIALSIVPRLLEEASKEVDAWQNEK